MAYGTLKADKITYDNGGTDTEVNVSDIVSKANLASPAFTGTPTAPTAAANTNTTQLATTAYVDQSAFAPLASPALTGAPTAPTAAADTNTTQVATTAYVQTEVGDYAPLAGATFTGDVKVGDDDYIKLGDSDDISLHHAAGGGSFFVTNAALYTRGTELYFQEEGDSNKEWIHCLPAGSVELSYDGDVALSTSSSGIQVEANNTSIPGLQGNVNVGGSGNCRLEAFSDNANNSAEDNNTFKIYSQHGTSNTTKTSILYQSFYDQVWRVKGEGGSGCSGITDAELGRINHDGGWELRYHDIQGTAPNWTGTTCDKKFETTSSGVKVTGAAVPASITALTDGATIATDLALNNNYSVTLAGNRTLGQPTNQTVGQSGSIFITQDGTGSRTLAYHADWKWAGGTAPTLSTTAAAVDRIDYIVAAANKIHAVATLAVA